MACIPKSFLIHKAHLIDSQSDGWNDEKITKTLLENVRVDYSRVRKLSKESDSTQLIGTLFYDMYHSIPKNIEFKKGQQIEFNGVNYTINSIDYLWDKTKLHHIELGLI